MFRHTSRLALLMLCGLACARQENLEVSELLEGTLIRVDAVRLKSEADLRERQALRREPRRVREASDHSEGMHKRRSRLLRDLVRARAIERDAAVAAEIASAIERDQEDREAMYEYWCTRGRAVRRDADGSADVCEVAGVHDGSASSECLRLGSRVLHDRARKSHAAARALTLHEQATARDRLTAAHRAHQGQRERFRKALRSTPVDMDEYANMHDAFCNSTLEASRRVQCRDWHELSAIVRQAKSTQK